MQTGTSRTKLDPDGEERFVSLRRALGVTSFGINQLVFKLRQRGRIHRDERQEEVYLVIEGTLTLVVEGEEQAVGRGELVRVAPEARRQLVNRGPERVVMVALGGDGEHTAATARRSPRWDDTQGALAPGGPAARRPAGLAPARPSARGRLVQPEGRALVVTAEPEAPVALLGSSSPSTSTSSTTPPSSRTRSLRPRCRRPRRRRTATRRRRRRGSRRAPRACES